MDAISLTFDDGPDRNWTPRLLDTLALGGLTATFFVIARRAAQQPALIARMLGEGHSVGLHCDEHARHTERDRAWLEGDTRTALSRLSSLGVSPALWRTPWGKTAPWTADIAVAHGLRLVHWNVDTHDWRGDGASLMFAATQAQLRPGAIVLAHDGIGPGALRHGAQETVAYVQLVADHARRRSLECRAMR